MNAENSRVKRAPRNAETAYFMMARNTAQDRNLTFEARGVLSYVLSKPSDWMVRPKDLQQNCGRDKVYKIIKELMDNGYITREYIRNGKIVIVEYTVWELPVDLTKFPENAETGIKFTEKPYYTDNRVLQTTESKQNTDSLGETSSPDENDPPVPSTRFTKTRFYAFNEQKLWFGVTNYTAAEATSKAEGLSKHGFTMIKGSELNLRPDADRLIGVVASNGTSSLFSVFAKYGFGIKIGQSVPKDIGSRIGDLLNQFAESLMMTRNEAEKDADLIKRVQSCYDAHKIHRPNLSLPNHSVSFISWWNEWVENHENKQPDQSSSSVTSGLKF